MTLQVQVPQGARPGQNIQVQVPAAAAPQQASYHPAAPAAGQGQGRGQPPPLQTPAVQDPRDPYWRSSQGQEQVTAQQPYGQQPLRTSASLSAATAASGKACGACTFENASGAASCEMCGSAL